MPRSPSIPKYRRHKQSSQAVVTLPDGIGGRRDVLLGKHGTAESRAEYARVIAEWEANARRLPPRSAAGFAPDLSVNEVALAYWNHAVVYYGFDKDPASGARYNLRDVLRLLRRLYGHTRAADFGPLALKACQAEMVRLGWSRTYVNAQVDRLRSAFKWAASEEMIAASIYEALRTVDGLRRGHTEAREGKKVKPVSGGHVEVTIPHMPPMVQAMVRLQQLTGCRPDEVCRLRPLDLDMGNPSCWVYRPGSDQGAHGEHKTAHHGHERIILIGPRAQEVLRPYLGTKLDGYCFNPAEGEAARSTRRRQARQTPLYPSHLKLMARKRKKRRVRAPGDRYDTAGYRRAIYRACDKAFPLPDRLAPRVVDGKRESRKAWWARLTVEEKAKVRAWRREHQWHPNRLRHSRATELRPHGLDVVKTILGHSKVETTQIYSEKDLAAAMELVSKIG
jgi:integrase